MKHGELFLGTFDGIYGWYQIRGYGNRKQVWLVEAL